MTTVDQDETQARISRRNALKAGAALGVGAAAFAGPQIGVLGTTPAYAAACSQPWVVVGQAGCTNTSCPAECNQGTAKFVSYKAQTVTGSNGATANATAGCGGTATATITAPSTTGQCRVRVKAYQGNPQCVANGAAGLLSEVVSASVAGGTSGTVVVPAASCAPASNVFYNLILECNGDTDTSCT